jgi:hypothetical protein
MAVIWTTSQRLTVFGNVFRVSTGVMVGGGRDARSRTASCLCARISLDARAWRPSAGNTLATVKPVDRPPIMFIRVWTDPRREPAIPRT